MAQITLNSTGVASDGSLVLQSNGTTTAVTISTAQVATLAKDAVVNGLTVGRGAGAVATNTAFGTSALTANSTNSNIVAIGNQALTSSTSNQCVAVGSQAMFSNTTGFGEAFGYQALYTNTTGSNNTAIGYRSQYLNTTGSNNVSVGLSALNSNTTASNNTAVGYQALYTTATGDNNTAIGYQALYNSNRTADNNDANTAVGYQAGLAKTTGNNNCFFGKAAGSNLTTGTGDIYIGQGCAASAVGVSSEIVIGTQATGKGTTTGFITAGAGGMYQGNNLTVWSVTSDQRLKKNIVDNNIGLNIINQIQVRNFEYRLPEEITDVAQDQAIAKTGVQLGVIAQELQQVAPDCVKTESTGVMTVNADPLTWYLINAVKELTARVAQLEAKGA